MLTRRLCSLAVSSYFCSLAVSAHLPSLLTRRLLSLLSLAPLAHSPSLSLFLRFAAHSPSLLTRCLLSSAHSPPHTAAVRRIIHRSRLRRLHCHQLATVASTASSHQSRLHYLHCRRLAVAVWGRPTPVAVASEHHLSSSPLSGLRYLNC
ncbi:hypothetical protein Scep_010566 [Stephania cephalantha]|uniref:Uncharacterized protein n=1 Tax=Stephania cephalantha TaxID=152367 RepID=A0AAP0JWB1_9MAGN